ncbi:MAG TPA: nucleotide sugar dehydrogenase [Thermoanaerobaculia bacterium]|nr:nucleotide sugar dehydrogenase [Thermoanaerobaculia bacterium]
MHTESQSSRSSTVDDRTFLHDVCVVGGCGHVGLPLALTFAEEGLNVAIYDINDAAVQKVKSGEMPFRENGANELMQRVQSGKNPLRVSSTPEVVSDSRCVVVVIGTPVDEHLNPTFHSMRRFFSRMLPHLRDGQCVILRSTIYPGSTEKMRDFLASKGLNVHVAYCPERVAEGKALEELRSLPQIVAGCDAEATRMAEELYRAIAKTIIHLKPMEAELTKIFANAWRYIQFATANQFLMIASEHDVDFYRIYDALTREYPRMAGLPKGGFAAGPCLLKDTMQLVAATDNTFALGHAAMLINEGMPNFIVRQLKEQHDLSNLTAGILGMAFKADSDDPRESLSYKLRKILEYEAGQVLCTDPYVKDEALLPLEDVLAQSDIIIVAAPHKQYRELRFREGQHVVDIWNTYGKGTTFA